MHRRPPEGGLCQEPGVDPSPWLFPMQTYDVPAALLLCRGCPVVAECRAYAAQLTWTAVVVGGWRAPAKAPMSPPWASGKPYPWPDDLELDALIRRRIYYRRRYRERRAAAELQC